MDTPHVGKAEVINCDFEYECPLDWFKLAATDNPKVRHCEVCGKPVTFCEDSREMLALQRTDPDAHVALHSSKIIRLDARTFRPGPPLSYLERVRNLWSSLDDDDLGEAPKSLPKTD